MTSKLVVNTIEADTGISSVSFASSISLSSTSKFFFSDAGIDIGPDTNINRPATGVLGFNINSGEKVRITSAGLVGINSTSPANALDVLGDVKIAQAAGTDAKLDINEGTTSNPLRIMQTATEARIQNIASQPLNIRSQGGSGSSGYLAFWTRDDERLRITSSGQIGIGTIAPDFNSTLHIHGGADSDKNYIRLTADRGLIARLGDTSSNAQAMFDLYDPSDGSTQIVRLISGGGDNWINTGGNLGINTTTPSALLDIGGNTDGNVQAIFTRGADPGFRIQAVNESSGNNVGDVVGKFGLFYSDTTDVAGFKFLRGSGTNSGSIVLTGGGNDRVHLTSGGNLVIGSNNAVPNTAAGITVNRGQAQAGNSMVGLLSNNTAHPNDAWNWGVYTRSVVGGISRIAGIGCYKVSSNNPAGCLAISQRDGGNTRVWADNNNVLRISNSNSHIGGTGGSVVGSQTSDIRLKNNLGSVSYGLTEINQINPIKFSFKKDESNRQQIGFSAQDIQSIIPEAVFNSECNYDIEGTQVDNTLGMDYVALVPVLVNAVKELSAKVAALEGS